MKTSEQLDATFAALADPTRRAILARLAKGEALVSELGARLPMGQAPISEHRRARGPPVAGAPPALSKPRRVRERAALVWRAGAARRRPPALVAEPLAAAN